MNYNVIHIIDTWRLSILFIIDMDSWKVLPFICIDKNSCGEGWSVSFGFLCLHIKLLAKSYYRR